MSNTVAAPQALIDVYPADGGALQLRGAQVISVSVQKALYEESGRFAIELPPSGPRGANGPSWAESIPPASLVVIGFRRWQYANVVMVGIVTETRYDERWQQGAGVQRRVIVEGEDLAFYFHQITYNTLCVLSGIGTAAGSRFGSAGFGLPAILGGALLSPNATPAAWSEAYWAEIVKPLLGKVTVPYLGNVQLGDAIATWFQEWPGYTIPMGAPFLSDMGSFGAMFRKALAFPFYETLMLTAPAGWFPVPAAGTVQPFQIAEISTQANFYLVGRRNPAPNLLVSVFGSDFTFDGMDASRWNALHTFEPDSGALATSLRFGVDGVRNFFAIDPSYLAGAAFGGSASNITPFFFLFGGAIDLNSVYRYGLAEEMLESTWFADIGSPSGATKQNYSQLVGDLTCWLAGYHEALPMMASGNVVYPLRPDIIPGSRFTFPAFRKLAPTLTGLWDFYIEGVRHDFVFGGQSTTTLTITRGLPSSIYDNPAHGALLEAIHTGNATRVNGEYGMQPGAAPNLQPFNVPGAQATIAQFQRWMQQPQQPQP